MKTKPVCETLLPWLRNNLGKTCLAPLTGQDAKALASAIHIIHLYAYCDSRDEEGCLTAFRCVVERMQPSTRELAYHGIAHVMDWHNRADVWSKAGLAPIKFPRMCAYERSGWQPENSSPGSLTFSTTAPARLGSARVCQVPGED